MNIKRGLVLLCCVLFVEVVLYASPIKNMIERIAPGHSHQFILKIKKSDIDFFELSQLGDKIQIIANNNVSQAMGLHWYLKYYAHQQISWDYMQVKLPEKLPRVEIPLRKETKYIYRYNFNYCTFSYSMAYWDWERWEKEIDWMALHGINLPLAITGVETVWYNVLKRLDYTEEEINNFISGTGYFAWWLMGNLEGFCGSNPASWYKEQAKLQKKIIKRMRELDIEPVFPGYSGMIPSNANEKLNIDAKETGMWVSHKRPYFLSPTDPAFVRIAEIYYEELTKLFGKSNYYSMDPFHEGGTTKGIDLDLAGQSIMKAMKRVNKDAIWVIQAWQGTPNPQLIKSLKEGDMLILDLNSETSPIYQATNVKKEYLQHYWIKCMLLNFGGNVGLHGKMQYVIDSFFDIQKTEAGKKMKGIGLTYEGIENNPVMYELYTELPWYEAKFEKEEWLKEYCRFRYGKYNENIHRAWVLLANSIYNCPASSTQQGTTESIFCTSPNVDVRNASSWCNSTDYYDPYAVIKSAKLFVNEAHKFKDSEHFKYDFIDILRQAIAEQGRIVYKQTMYALKENDIQKFDENVAKFLELIILQDELLDLHPDFTLANWLRKPLERAGDNAFAKISYEKNARMQISIWDLRPKGAKTTALRDYSHREWSGMLKDVYYPRWLSFFNTKRQELEGKKVVEENYYEMDEKWVFQRNPYPFKGKDENLIDKALLIFSKAFPDTY